MNARRLAVPAVVLAIALLGAAAALAVVAMRQPAGPRTTQERIRAVASTLRCPVCQDLSVADSPSGLARQMRAEIGADLRAGMTPNQVRARFVRAYGDWILLSPPRRGLGLVVWLFPLLLLVAGLVAVGFALRRWTLGGAGPPAAASVSANGLSDQDRQLLEHAMATVEDEPE